MKIDNSIKSSGSVSGEQKTRASRDSQTSSASASDSKVQLSSLSGRMQQIEQTVAQSPVVDTAKVSEIKQAITDGQFKVDPEKVADGLIESVRQMLAAQPRAA
jgi:negative regulator of flagellin synthesis FlgM